MKLDTKSIIIGLLLGIITTMICGADGTSSAGIGFSVPSGGKAVLKASSGEAFIIDMDSGMAKMILFKKSEPGEPRYPNNLNGRALILAD